MPVRSSTSSVLIWPAPETVVRAAEAWAHEVLERQPVVRRIGYFGTYATGRAGVGSDLDVVAVVDASGEPFERRAVSWDTTLLPVPVDLLIYTEAEWQALVTSDRGFGRELRDRTRWLAVRR